MITFVNSSPEYEFTLVSMFSKLAAATSVTLILRGIVSIQEKATILWHHIPLLRLHKQLLE